MLVAAALRAGDPPDEQLAHSQDLPAPTKAPPKDSPCLPLTPWRFLSLLRGEGGPLFSPPLAEGGKLPSLPVPLAFSQDGEVECAFTPCPELDCPREEWWLGPGQCCFTCREPAPKTGEHPGGG